MRGVVSYGGELIVFAHGMANFEHNRGTKAEQERLVRSRVDSRHGFLGAFDDSGNYAFISTLRAASVAEAVVAALNTEYEVKGAVVVDRASCVAALAEAEGVTLKRYASRFDRSDYSVRDATGRWRLGLLFVNPSSSLHDGVRDRLLGLENERLKILIARAGVIGVLKYDEGKRIPWGQPGGVVARLLKAAFEGGASELVATGRSARTVRGVLRLFGDHDLAARRPSNMRSPGPSGRDEGDRVDASLITGRPVSPGNRDDSFEEIWHPLNDHPALERSGLRVVFKDLAREIWEETQGQIVPRRAGERDAYVPFSWHGTRKNVADIRRFQLGEIEFILKSNLSEAELHRIGGPRREELRRLTNLTGRWTSYEGGLGFTLRGRGDVRLLKDLICVSARMRLASAASAERNVRLPHPEAPGQGASDH